MFSAITAAIITATKQRHINKKLTKDYWTWYKRNQFWPLRNFRDGKLFNKFLVHLSIHSLLSRCPNTFLQYVYIVDEPKMSLEGWLFLLWGWFFEPNYNALMKRSGTELLKFTIMLIFLTTLKSEVFKSQFEMIKFSRLIQFRVLWFHYYY